MVIEKYNPKWTDKFNLIKQMLERNLREYISIVIVDVNGLKQVIDEKGHTAGDELIIKTAESIHELYSNHGRTFRIGWDEFAIIIKEPLDDVQDCVKQIQNRIAKTEYSDEVEIGAGWKTRILSKLGVTSKKELMIRFGDIWGIKL